MLHDFRLALRSLRRAPTYAVAAIAALALAIGANTALFSLIEATLLRPFPYPRPEQVLIVREKTPQFGDSSVALPNFRDWREQTRDSFSGMAAFRADSFNLTGSGDPERVAGRMVSADFFDVLGARPLAGRLFSQTDDQPGAARTVVLTSALWQRRFASDPRVVGQTITLTGYPYTIIGVLPPGFRFLSSQELFVPLGLWADQFKSRDDHPAISVVARLRNGVSIEQGRAALDAVAQRLEKEYPLSNTDHRVAAKTIQAQQTDDFRAALLVLWGAVALVLLIAAANVANLALARAAARAPELAIRAALGAGRGRIARELLTESVLLALAGGGLGILLAVWGLDALLPWVPEVLRRNADVRLNGTVLAFTAALSVMTGLLFGALPALRASRPDLDGLLRESHSSEPRPRRRLRSALVVAEIALSLSLLIGAGLLMRSFAALARVDMGVDPSGAVAMKVSLPEARYRDGNSEIRFEQEVRRRLSSLPGARAVALAAAMPLFDDNSMNDFWVEGRPRPQPRDRISAYQYSVTPGFLQAIGGRLLRGRDIQDDDTLRKPVVLIDDGLARRLFGQEDPLGHHIALPPEIVGDMRGPEIVGVYRHMQQYGPADVNAIDSGMIMPFAIGAEFMPQWFRGLTIVVRGEGDLSLLASAARREIAALDPELPVYSVKTLQAAVEDSVAQRRFMLLLLTLFAGVALSLAAVGIYGVISYGVVQRTREIGIRMALGAEQKTVLRLVVGDGMRLAALGIAAGIGLAVALSRALRGMLFGVSAFDPIAYVALTAVLAGVALVACWLPARRASRVDPATALRSD